MRKLSPQPRRRRTIADLLGDQIHEFDDLVAEVTGGIRGPMHYDALETRASAIAGAIRAAFREGERA